MHNVPRLGHFGCRAVGDDDELVSLEGGFVFDDTVFGNTDTVESRADRGHPTDHYCTFERSDNPRDHRASDQYRSDSGYRKEGGAE